MFTEQIKDVIVNTIKDYPGMRDVGDEIVLLMVAKAPNEQASWGFRFNGLGDYSFSEFAEATIEGDFLYYAHRRGQRRVNISGITSVAVEFSTYRNGITTLVNEFIVFSDGTVKSNMKLTPVSEYMTFSEHIEDRIEDV